MNSLAQLFTSKDVLLDLDVRNKSTLFDAIGNLWQEHHGLAAEKVAASLNAREKLGSTGLGKGVAIPHARMDGLPEALVAVVRVKAPIEFDSPDGKPVSCFFVLLAPTHATEQHLQILADVARMLADTQFRDQLDAAKSRDEVHQLFAAWPIAAKGKLE